MHFSYLLTISFKGTRYSGWQVQDNEITVQGELNRVLKQIFKNSSDIRTLASGRTDAGVHALKQIVKIDVPFAIGHQELKNALNSLLGADIRILNVEDIHGDFMPTVHSKKKEYWYLFTNKAQLSPFQAEIMVNINFDLDFELMQKACQLFCGEHDFTDFHCVGSDVKTTNRIIYECKIVKKDVHFLQNAFGTHYEFQVIGNGFLKQMVRLMMGTVWDIGRGKSTLAQLELALSKPQGIKLGATAPPHALFLANVEYQ